MIIFIIPHHLVGGAERVHAEIVKAVGTLKRIVILFDYTDSSPVSQDFDDFTYITIGKSKLKRVVCMVSIVLLSWILPLTIFGCNSYFFFKLLSLVHKKTVTIDLTHAFSFPDPGIEDYAKHYVPLITKRVVINRRTLDDYWSQYLKEGIDLRYMQRFQIIPNGVNINNFDEELIQKRYRDFTIGYVGRFSLEKRPELFLALSRKRYSFQCSAKMISDRFDASILDYPDLNLIIGVNDPARIRTEFSMISVLIITSIREGFPLVIMEAMELGIPVISTNVGSIQEHVINDFNGYVADAYDSEAFLDFCYQKIDLLANNEKLYSDIANNARQYAVKKFNIEDMRKAYKRLFIDA